MKEIDKKGLSPAVATILLIALILVLAAIIFLWTRGFLKESVEKNGLKAEEACAQVRFDAYYNANPTSPDYHKLSIVNEGNVPIRGFEIKQSKGGDSRRIPYYFAVGPGSALPPRSVGLSGDLDSIEFFPIILTVPNSNPDRTKFYTCLDNSKKVTIQ